MKKLLILLPILIFLSCKKRMLEYANPEKSQDKTEYSQEVIINPEKK